MCIDCPEPGSSFKMNGLVLPMSARAKSLMLFTSLALAAVEPASRRSAWPVARPVTAAPAKPAAASRPGPSPRRRERRFPAIPISRPTRRSLFNRARPPPLPPAVWDLVSAQDLLYYIQQIGKDGLSPADYDPAGLAAAIQTGDPLTVSKEATDRFNRLSSDLALGHVRRPARIDWYRDRQRSRCSQAGRAAAQRARPAQYPGALERPAADPPAICGAQGRAGR